MGESRDRQKLTGYLTKAEQVTLGMTAIAFGRPDQGKPAAEKNSDTRAKKIQAIDQLGVAWVAEQAEERDSNPEFRGKLRFDREQITDEKVLFTIDKDLLAWVIDELDRIPCGSGEDARLNRITQRLIDLKRGDFKMPPELLGTASDPVNGVARAAEHLPVQAALPPA